MTPRTDAQRDRALIEAHRLLTDVSALPDVLAAVRDVVLRAMAGERVDLVWIVDDVARYQILDDEVVLDDLKGVEPGDQPLMDELLGGGHRVLLADLGEREGETRGEIGPVMMAPLVRSGVLRGVLQVSRPPGREPFERDDAEFLSELGESIVFVVANAHLHDELTRLSAENRQLCAISVSLGQALELGELLRRILDHLGEIVPYDAAGIYLKRGDDIQWLEHVGYPGDAQEPLHLKLGEGIVGRVTEGGKPALVGDVLEDPDYVSARPQTRSEMVVPIASSAGDADGAIIGAFNVESDRPHAFTERDLERLEVFASLATVAIDREWARALGEEKQRIDRELAVARRIQQYFLPRRTPIVPGYELWGSQRPSIEMSGDYYDVIPVADGHFGLVVADVSGKGVPAALIMASVRAGLISEVRNVYAIRRVIAEVNQFLVDSIEQGSFVTAFYGVLDAANRQLTFVNAGHEPPLLYRPDEGAQWLSTGGTILGAFPDLSFEESRVVLRPNDLLVLYTDGVTEARRDGDEFFGQERILEVVAREEWSSAKALGEALMGEVRAFSGRDDPEDDETLLVVRVP